MLLTIGIIVVVGLIVWGVYSYLKNGEDIFYPEFTPETLTPKKVVKARKSTKKNVK